MVEMSVPGVGLVLAPRQHLRGIVGVGEGQIAIDVQVEGVAQDLLVRQLEAAQADHRQQQLPNATLGQAIERLECIDRLKDDDARGPNPFLAAFDVLQ